MAWWYGSGLRVTSPTVVPGGYVPFLGEMFAFVGRAETAMITGNRAIPNVPGMLNRASDGRCTTNQNCPIKTQIGVGDTTSTFAASENFGPSEPAKWLFQDCAEVSSVVSSAPLWFEPLEDRRLLSITVNRGGT